MAEQQRIAALEAELADFRHLFDLQQRRMQDAIARWRSEAPEERATVLPDLGDLLGWLLDQLDSATAQAADMAVEADRLQQRLAVREWGVPDGH